MIRINGHVIDKATFPDGTLRLMELPQLSFPIDAPNKRITFEWCYDSDDELIALGMLASHYRERHPSLPMTLSMPYIPNARMDRVHDESECFTLRYFCRFVNSLGFDRVDVFDPHSDVAPALLDRVRVHMPDSEIRQAIHLAGDARVFFPDAGACKRYPAEIGGVGPVIGRKHRDWKTGRISGYTISDDVSSGNIIIVDDICSRGGTFVRAIGAMNQEVPHQSWGPNKVSLYVSHCEKSVFEGSLFSTDPFDTLYTTDSILRPEDVPSELASRVVFVRRFRP